MPQTLLEETLATALFTAVDLARVTWSHRSVAEYLAARWLKANDITGDRATPLLFHRIETSKVIPQLRGVAAWLASFDRNTFDRLVDTDPLVLVTADAGTFDEDARARIVSAFLDKLDKFEAHDWMGGVRRYYANLAHSGLAEQLRPYIVDETKNRVVRRAAIDIAKACSVTALDQTLADLALDHAADYDTRVQAVWALRKIGSDNALRRLRELLLDRYADPDDELLGSVLHALWPDHLSAQELVQTLRPRRAPLTIGAYWAFLSALPEKLPDADVSLVLEWATNHIDALLDEELLPKLVYRAQSLLANPAVRSAYVGLLVKGLKHDIFAVTKAFLSCDLATRKELLPLIIEQVDDAYFVWSLLRGAPTAELSWLLSLLDAPLSATGRENLIELLRLLLSEREDVEFIEALVTAASVHADLATGLGLYLNGVDLDSDLARRMRDEHARCQKRNARWPRGPQRPPLSERIRDALECLESGDLDGFLQLSVLLPLEPDSQAPHYRGVPRTRIVEEPGWNAADDATRARIVAGAQRYLEGRDAEADTWLGKNLVYYPALAGYRALQLLADVDRGRLDSLSPAIWRRWAPAIAAWQMMRSELDDNFVELLKRAYRVAPVEVLDTLLRVIAHENRELRRLSTTDAFECIWDERIACALMSVVRQRGVHRETKGQLLTLLLRHRVPGALRLCERLLRRALRRASDERCVGRILKRRQQSVRAKHQGRLWHPNAPLRKTPLRRRNLDLAVALCQALVDGDPHSGWPIVWRRIRNDLTFGRAALLRIANRTGLDAPSWLHSLAEEQVAELYGWMVRAFPPNEDPVFKTAHAVTPREAVGWLRGSLIRHLRNRKTLAARDALRHLAEETGDKSLLLHAVDAEQQALDGTWVAFTVADLLKLSEQRDTHVVLSEAHLLDVVVAELHELDKRLQSGTVRFLWDEAAARPKKEEALSQLIEERLRERLESRGVITNAEVRVRPRLGERPAEVTDIHVDAVIPRTKERVSVIIEVKGNWNRELETALDTQLGDRYLVNNPCRHGVYVVGWFESPLWDQSDWRRREAACRDLDATRKLLEERAAERAKQGQTIKVVILNAQM